MSYGDSPLNPKGPMIFSSSSGRILKPGERLEMGSRNVRSHYVVMLPALFIELPTSNGFYYFIIFRFVILNYAFFSSFFEER